MYEYIDGAVAQRMPTYVTLDCHGVGYGIHVSLLTAQAVRDAQRAKLYIHLYVREDDQRLYGFSTVLERDIFRALISVSGVGANTALLVLSALSPDQVVQIVQSDDAESFRRIKGIGPKTAQRMIIDLKGKLTGSGSSGATQESMGAGGSATGGNTLRAEALSALVHLGFKRPDAEKVIKKILSKSPDMRVEDLVRQALGALS